MPSIAIHRNGQLIDADAIDVDTWEAMKMTVGDAFTMTCCGASAVLKTSMNGRPFFAHYNGECATAPETAWHRDGKMLIRTKLAALGIECREEVSGGSKTTAWRADTLFVVGNRTIVIEMQRSYQLLREYLYRQERYAKAGIESYWLTRKENFLLSRVHVQSFVSNAISMENTQEKDSGGRLRNCRLRIWTPARKHELLLQDCTHLA